MNALITARRLLTAVAAIAAGAAVVGLATSLVPTDGPGALRLVLVLYVGVLGALVARYAATNLRGQQSQERFAALLVAAVLGLLLMVSAEDLAVAAVGWTASGLATAALVAHRGDAAARRAGRVVAGRLLYGDAALWSAVAVVHLGGPATAVALLLAAAIAVRSSLVPLHRWLPETAEAPSPVSALLHAGVVNGGGMLGLLFWPLLSAGRAALLVLVLAGVASVAVGLAAMRLRADVKGRLAASTTAQMGLVAVQLGLALPAAALLHVLGHGCWKAWLFLRAGGTVDRARHAAAATSGASATSGPARRWAVPLLVAVVAAGTVGTGWAVGAGLGLGTGLLFPAALAAVVAAVGVHEAAGLRGAARSTRVVLTALAAGVPAGYLLWVGLVDRATERWFGAGPAAVGPAPAALALLAAAAVVVLGLLAARLRPDSTGPVATAVAATLLPPGALPRGAVRPAPTEPDLTPGGLPVDHLPTVVELAATAVGPAWPLRSMVAANPLAPLEKLAVEDAASTIRLLHGRDPRPRLGTFLDLHRRGVISDSALRRSLQEHDPTGATARPGPPRLGATSDGPLAGISPADLVEFSRVVARGDVDGTPLRVRACDRVGTPDGRSPAERLELLAAAWTARAWGSVPTGAAPATDPWSLWRRSAAGAGFDRSWRIGGGSAFARSLPEDPRRAIAVLWPRVQRVTGEQDLYTYLACVLTAARGWAAHARWRARRAGGAEPLVQLVALHMALDVLLAEAAGSPAPEPATAAPRDTDVATALHLVSVWQRALDLSARDGLLRSLLAPAAPGAGEADPTAPAVQSVWCIDARSERVRRHLEHHGGHETFGYAGFFGAAVRHRDADGQVADLCPGPLQPVVDTHEPARVLTAGGALGRVVARIGDRPAAAFAYAEMSGVPALLGTLAATLVPARARRARTAWTGRSATLPPQVDGLPDAIAADVAEQLLRTTGLGARTAPVVVLVGHGSSTENNAFASAYDCGACGGNTGATSATLVADALNRPAVRRILAERGLELPAGTVFVAAAHDTTVDEVVLLRRPAGESRELAVALDRAAHDLARAAAGAAEERELALPGSGRPRHLGALADRAADWAEPMPEWGLAGNMALIVGPRSVSRSLDLGGTAFLHSYDPDQDPDGSCLEQVLTGPVVVTQWISAQYYASAAAPELFGAGDKTTHNVVGDVGVVTGAHGDLRTGLPWQAVSSHDPEAPGADTSHLRHLPVRHLVVLVADPERTADLVRRHAALYQAVGNGWMQLVVLPPRSGRVLELDRHLQWQPCVVPALAHHVLPEVGGEDGGADGGARVDRPESPDVQR